MYRNRLNRDNLIRRFEEYLADDGRSQQDKRRAVGEFHYIPLSLDAFEQQLNFVLCLLEGEPQRPLAFVDVGCGIGTKLLCARILSPGLILCGIEKDPRYTKIARRLVSNSGDRGYGSVGGDLRARILTRDALRASYKHYDIIYFYSPLSDDKKETRLEQRMISTAKKGTFFLCNLPKHDWDHDERVKRITDGIYRKK